MRFFDSGERYDSGICYDEPSAHVIIKPTHMRDLHIWPTNPFDDQKISLAELISFGSDNLQRMIANPLPALTARITATTAALAGVNAAFTDDDTKLALRKAHKQAKNDYRAGLPPRIGKIAVAVENEFGEGSAEFVDCFPHGRKLFSDCPDDELAANLQTLINGVHAHVADLGAPVETAANALLTGWNAVYATSESAAGAKTTTEAAKRDARAALQLELFFNLLTLAQAFPRQPAQLDLYMQQNLLSPHTHAPTPPAPPATPTTEP